MSKSLREKLKAKREPPRHDAIANFSKTLQCPIDWATFKDPVIASDGHTYERFHLHCWFNRSQDPLYGYPLSPLTGERLKSRSVVSNYCISAIAKVWTTDPDPLPKMMQLVQCPLSKLPFTDPVVACDGNSYEKGQISRVLTQKAENGFPVSPVTGQPMYLKTLVSNVVLKRVVKGLEELKGLDLSGYDRLKKEAVHVTAISVESLGDALFEF
ncbi:UNVERIFIED_CONTAM: hypothetical protein HDU68_009970 [Siphonaria sp. JEL0065]|nr:hypothetical protein HDU68_009970 [Siphonaria sp. JEL0065]